MKTATISETKNKLSELLAAVRAGESLTILDRKRPIATIEAVREVSDNPHVNASEDSWEPGKLLSLPIAESAGGDTGLIEAVAEERESGW